MVQKGHITLEVVPSTRNRKRICLTEEGRTYGETMISPVSNAELRAFEKYLKQSVLAALRSSAITFAF